MHLDGTISLGNILTILATCGGLIAGGVRMAFHLDRSSTATTNLVTVTERLQKAIELHDSRLTSLEVAAAISEGVRLRMGGE